MAQLEQLSGLNLDRLQEMKDAIAVGQHPEMIPGYRPAEANRQLIGDTLLFRTFPDLMPAYEPEDLANPKATIIEMTQVLDEKIMNDPRRVQASGFLSFDVGGVKLEDDTCLSLKRQASLGELAVTVCHILADSPTYPRVESEEFTVTDKGEFVMHQNEVHIPGDGAMPVEVAKFDLYHADFTQDIAEKYDYFCQLVQTYLGAEEKAT